MKYSWRSLECNSIHFLGSLKIMYYLILSYRSLPLARSDLCTARSMGAISLVSRKVTTVLAAGFSIRRETTVVAVSLENRTYRKVTIVKNLQHLRLNSTWVISDLHLNHGKMAINERKGNEVYLNYKKRIFYFECQFHTMIMLLDLYVSIGNIIFVCSRCLF